MKLITIADHLLTVSRRWDGNYPPDAPHVKAEHLAIGDRLRKLPLDATADDVTEVIGNDSWGVIQCDACGHRVHRLVEIDFLYDTSRALCENCLRRAMNLI